MLVAVFRAMNSIVIRAVAFGTEIIKSTQYPLLHTYSREYTCTVTQHNIHIYHSLKWRRSMESHAKYFHVHPLCSHTSAPEKCIQTPFY